MGTTNILESDLVFHNQERGVLLAAKFKILSLYSHGTISESGIKVIVTQPTNRTESLMQCCQDKKVKLECQGICTFNLDLDFLMYDSQCFTEFDKLMSCGSDGSDHR